MLTENLMDISLTRRMDEMRHLVNFMRRVFNQSGIVTSRDNN